MNTLVPQLSFGVTVVFFIAHLNIPYNTDLDIMEFYKEIIGK